MARGLSLKVPRGGEPRLMFLIELEVTSTSVARGVPFCDLARSQSTSDRRTGQTLHVHDYAQMCFHCLRACPQAFTNLKLQDDAFFQKMMRLDGSAVEVGPRLKHGLLRIILT